MNDLDIAEPDKFLYSIKNNTSKKPEKEKDDFEGLKQDITTFNNLKNELLDSLKEKFLKINYNNIKISRQLKQT